MTSPQSYMQKLSEILGQPVPNTSITLTLGFKWNNEEDAKRTLKIMTISQKELRLLKREINLTAQEISKAYITERVAVGKTVGWGVARGFFGRNAVGAFSMAKRNDLTIQKDRALLPYRQLMNSIDNAILTVDKTKSEIELEILRHKATS